MILGTLKQVPSRAGAFGERLPGREAGPERVGPQRRRLAGRQGVGHGLHARDVQLAELGHVVEDGGELALRRPAPPRRKAGAGPARATRRTSSSESAMVRRLAGAGLGLEPVEDGRPPRRCPSCLTMVSSSPWSRKMPWQEKQTSTSIPWYFTSCSSRPHLGQRMKWSSLSRLQLGGLGLLLHLQGQLALLLGVLADEVLVLGLGGLAGGSVGRHGHSLSWLSAFRATAASSPSGWAAR